MRVNIQVSGQGGIAVCSWSEVCDAPYLSAGPAAAEQLSGRATHRRIAKPYSEYLPVSRNPAYVERPCGTFVPPVMYRTVCARPATSAHERVLIASVEHKQRAISQPHADCNEATVLSGQRILLVPASVSLVPSLGGTWMYYSMLITAFLGSVLPLHVNVVVDTFHPQTASWNSAPGLCFIACARPAVTHGVSHLQTRHAH